MDLALPPFVVAAADVLIVAVASVVVAAVELLVAGVFVVGAISIASKVASGRHYYQLFVAWAPRVAKFPPRFRSAP